MNSSIRPARFLIEDLATPSLTPLSVVTTLADFAIITYAVEPSALAKHLPAGFEPEIFLLGNGTRCALVSAVTFRDLDFRLCACPWPRFSFGQTNYRAYVLHQGRRVAWFFGTSLATPFVIVPRHLWLLPWHHAKMRFSTAWREDVCARYELNTMGSWGAAELILEGTNEPGGCLDGFHDSEDTSVILTHPLVGVYLRRDGKVGTYSVWHDRLVMSRAIAKRAHFEVFQKLGLCQIGQKPHSVVVQRETEFTILLPPKLVAS